MAKEENNKKNISKKNDTKSKSKSKTVNGKSSLDKEKKKTSTSVKSKAALKTKEVNIKQLTVDETIEDEKLEKSETNSKKASKKIKTSDILLIVGLLVVLVVGLFALGSGKEEPSYELPLTLEGNAGLQLLSYSDYQTKIDNNEAFVVILARESCSHCANFIPVAKDFAEKNKLPMYYIDTDTFSESDWSTFEKSNTFLKKKSGNWGTPTTVLLVGSEAVDYIEGETTADNLLNLYNKYFDMK